MSLFPQPIQSKSGATFYALPAAWQAPPKPPLQTLPRSDRLPWPVAAPIIALLSLSLWLAIGELAIRMIA